MIKYKVVTWIGAGINEVEIVRETAKCIFRKGNNGRELKELKESDGVLFCDTHAEAKAHLLKILEYKRKSAQKRLDTIHSYIENAENL